MDEVPVTYNVLSSKFLISSAEIVRSYMPSNTILFNRNMIIDENNMGYQ